MKLYKQLAFAIGLTVASAYFALAPARAHEFKVGSITVEHPWARQAPGSAQVLGGYMKIVNAGSADDRLVKVTAPIAPEIQLHEMKMEGSVMKMSELPNGIPVKAGQTVVLKPMDLHVMFMNVPEQPKAGAKFPATLTFEKAGSLSVEFEVKPPGSGME
ncbi:MAG: copper chaperone PCu(A)C [Hyphomicrobiales bacterium]